METNALSLVLVMAAVTFILRGLPFAAPLPAKLVSSLRKAESKLPTLFLALLVVYCLEPALKWSSPDRTASKENLYLLIASFVVALAHWFWGRLLLSLFLGTGLYLLLMNLN